METQGERLRAAVIVPCRDGADSLAACLAALAPQLVPGRAVALVIDDASRVPLAEAPATRGFFDGGRIRVVRRPRAGGPGAARNTGFAQARLLGVDVVVLLDSDCVPPPDYVATHLALHDEMPDVACVGGAIEGFGEGFWARVDAAMSWFTSIPGTPAREVRFPVHIPTANMSLKAAALEPFVEGLRYAGEDTLFVLALLANGRRARYAARPVLRHRDRIGFAAVFRHQFRWGYHTYWIRVGFDMSPLKRAAFAAGILLASPVYAGLASWYVLAAWLRARPGDWTLAPAVVALSAAKAVAAAWGALVPSRAFHPGMSPAERPVSNP
ncbi:MAG: glycosyltransferase [Tagaea sp.]|nr:glycosyltransferase [Tagaea sp.]